MWKYYNPNPTERNVGDCSIRALSKALNISWEQAYILATTMGYEMGDMPSADAVWGAVLKQHGFYRAVIPNRCPECYTAEQFAEENPKGIYVLGFGGHVATVKDGVLYDSWDSSKECPVYLWYRKRNR